jgi:hypothetical protein
MRSSGVNNRTFVCFACRTTERDSSLRITRKCRKCRRLAERVYYKFRIPAADDDRGWDELMQKVRVFNREARAGALKWLAEQRVRCESKLGRLKASQIRKRRELNTRLRELQERMAEWELT